MKFKEKIKADPLIASEINVLQVNLGYRCNMACKHCHVQAGPQRDEHMNRENIETVLNALITNDIKTLDITGGAPELNPNFEYLVAQATGENRRVIVRSNLTIFFEEGLGSLPEFYRDNNVEVIASLPYYIEDSVDRVRGNGAFQKSIDALQKLNNLGYGHNSDHAVLNLVYNPQGAFLPPSQAELEEEYKKELFKNYGISFNHLYTFANMPIGRFGDFLVRTRNLDKYMENLERSFNPETLESVMCRHIINVGWDGRLYDCDFNQMIGLGVIDGNPQHIKDFDFHLLSERHISVDEHCYGCTAGQGST
jgi:radical SAM/Cys-rich protein